MLHKRLSPAQIKRVQSGCHLRGLLVTGGKNTENRVLYFDNLSVFTEEFRPLKFEPRPERGVTLFPGQSPGANTGPGRLPFPNNPQTILPDNISSDFSISLGEKNGMNTLNYIGKDGALQYRYKPSTGTWSDLEAVWNPTPSKTNSPTTAISFHPCTDGGVYLQTEKGPLVPDKAELLGLAQHDDYYEARWKLTAAKTTAEVTYRFHLWKKSLVIDVISLGGNIAEVRFGRATGLDNSRLVTNPYYPADGGRPAVVVSGDDSNPLFLSGNADWYLSNGSTLWAKNSIGSDGVVYNGGTRYVPLTDGKRNDCFERFFITVTPYYEETLPNIPNPPSPWKQITGTKIWRAHGASNRDHDKQYWANVSRHGMTEIIVTDHETMWRDEGESFTFRTKAAPGKGGDDGAREYARFMQDKLGFTYGPYNNYTDFAPVNEFWNTDMVARDPQNQLQHAWMRCYAPKPARAVEYCARLAPQIQEKFHFSTAYCDVHTAVAPWHRVDYDPRVPGAGTFGAVYYSFGEIMLHQKKAWNGPVYSEGNYHSFYMGLTDGNYGQDQSYRPAENPWLVDFDLRKMHALGCNFGMGNMEMFYANVPQPRNTREERDAELDRFLAATVAFGHPGFLVMENGISSALRSYYMLQQLQSRYCLSQPDLIQYVDAKGIAWDTTHAVANGAYKRSQVITRYADGTVTAANGSRTDRLVCDLFGHQIDLPPNGYAGWSGDGKVFVSSSDIQGRRCDYAASPAYVYSDGRGRFTRFDQTACDGQLVVIKQTNNTLEVIPVKCTAFGIKTGTPSAAVMALDKERKVIGNAEARISRGYIYIQPVTNAFSYRVSGSQTKMPALNASLQAIPGQTIPVTCPIETAGPAKTINVVIPKTARVDTLHWENVNGSWIDFSIVPIADSRLSISNRFTLSLTPHLSCANARVTFDGQVQPARFNKDKTLLIEFPFVTPATETERVIPLRIEAENLVMQEQWKFKARKALASVVPWPERRTTGQCFRGKPETSLDGVSGAVVAPQSMTSGGKSRKALFMHPPYQGGTGYSFAVHEPVQLPANPPAAFRCDIGKGDGSDRGDGILFRVFVIPAGGKEVLVAEKTWADHAWTPFEADLSKWAGHSIQIKLVADAGPTDNSSGDWAAWSGMRLESIQPVMQSTVEKQQ